MTRQLEVLDEQACIGLLRGRFFGRVAFVAEGVPQVRPVNYRFHDDAVVFRTAEGGLLDAVHLASVAFEIDDIDVEYHTGWSVIVQGMGEQVRRSSELEALRQLPLRPWAPEDRDTYVRIVPREITGRRIV